MNRHEWMERMGTHFVSEPNTGCWLWFRSTGPTGYGQLTVGGRTVIAHRYAYEVTHGPIPPGLTIDHLCRTRCCVNPDHLEAVPLRVNILRGRCPAAENVRKTHCSNGHEFTADNTYWRPDGDGRICRTCQRARTAANDKKRRTAHMQPRKGIGTEHEDAGSSGTESEEAR